MYKRWCICNNSASLVSVFMVSNFMILNGTKKVPKIIGKLLKLFFAFTYWYMDDGAQKWKGKSRGVRFCTDNFTFQHRERLGNPV